MEIDSNNTKFLLGKTLSMIPICVIMIKFTLMLRAEISKFTLNMTILFIRLSVLPDLNGALGSI